MKTRRTSRFWEKDPTLSSLYNLFLTELQDIYWAEQAMVNALPEMISNAQSNDLKIAIHDHLEITRNQVKRAEMVFEALGQPAKSRKCEAMSGLIREAAELMEEFRNNPALDAAIIAAVQKIEHYEIASYGTLVTYAQHLELTQVASLLRDTLKEEKQTDILLSQIAVSIVNQEALEDEEAEE